MPIFLDMHMAEIIPEAISMTLLFIHIYCQLLSFSLSSLCFVTVFLSVNCYCFLLSCQLNAFVMLVVQFTETEVPQWKIV